MKDQRQYVFRVKMKNIKKYLILGVVLGLSAIAGCKRPPTVLKKNMPEAGGYDVMVTYLSGLEKKANREIRVGTLKNNRKSFYGPFIYGRDNNGDDELDVIHNHFGEDNCLRELVNKKDLDKIMSKF